MPKQIVLLSGPVSSGKSTLAKLLGERFGLHHFRTRILLEREDPDVDPERRAMQKLGERLDRTRRGRWVCDGLMRWLAQEGIPEDAVVAVDAVRIKPQITGVRKAFGSRVVHIHLDAPDSTLRERYSRRPHDGIKELRSYRQVQSDPTERKVRELASIADVVVDTHRCTRGDVMVKAASQLGLYGRDCSRTVDVLIGGQYGSEGKGNIAAFLAPEYDLLIRVGGPNAGHTAYAEPDPHVFHHLPSGTAAAPKAKILIGPGATVYVPDLMREIARYEVDQQRLAIDPQVMLIQARDKKKEQSLRDTMGSTAQGVGAASARRILHRKPGQVKLAKDSRELRPFIREAGYILEESLRNGSRMFLEGTQGTGLSLYHGHYPYVTSRDTTVAGCLAEAGISSNRTRRIIMVCRTYPIRVQDPPGGTSGPMAQEITWRDVESRSHHKKGVIEKAEITTTTKTKRRVGEFEWVGLRRAALLNAPTDIALTFVDHLDRKNARARRFEQLEEDTIRFIEEVERVAAAPVSLVSTRFDYRNIIDRRAW